MPALARSLRHANPQVRANAAEALGKLGAAALPAVPALTLAAQDAEAVVRAGGGPALGEAGGADPDAGRRCWPRRGTASPEVRAAAVEALGKGGAAPGARPQPCSPPPATPATRSRSRPPGRCRGVAGPTPAALDALRGLLRDGSVPVQVEAAQALGRLGPDAAAAGEDLLRP